MLASLSAVHAAIACALFHGVHFDDAFIVYRYGQNLAGGQGLSFNVGERVWGATTVSWVFIAAGVHRLVGHDALPAVMACLGSCAWTAQSILIFLLLREAGRARVGALAAAALALGAAGSFCWVGMETHLAFALGLGALYASFRSRWALGAVLSAAAILTRPAAVVPALLVAILAWQRLRRGALRYLALGVALLVPWYAYQVAHFGSPLASSMSAKIGLSTFGHYALHLLTIVPAELLAMVTGWSAPLTALYAAPVVWPVVGLGAVALVRADRRLAVLPAWLLAHFAGYLAWRPLTNQTWHVYPAVAIAVVLLWAGLVEIARRFRTTNSTARIALGIVGLALFGVTLRRTASFATTGKNEIFWFGGRHRAYRAAARMISASSRPGDLVAAGEVGTLAYYTGIPVLDWNGLVTPGSRDLVDSLARGEPGRVRWVAAWAIEDLVYFSASLNGHASWVWRIHGSERSIYMFDLASPATPPQ